MRDVHVASMWAALMTVYCRVGCSGEESSVCDARIDHSTDNDAHYALGTA